jgi:GGDEF domain-containing protein
LAFILPDTSLDNATTLAEKLRQIAATVRPAWGGDDLKISAAVAEVTARPADDTEDRVTEWINRAEAGVDEIRHHGGNIVVPMETP